MVDVNESSGSVQSSDAFAFDLIERLFFGYRDFVGVADAALSETGYGRAHHRVIHFVDRHPGLTVGALLDILKVTKQGLSRVLRTLKEDGLITVTPGEADRREKHLATTAEGHALARRLARLQTERIRAALDDAGPGARDAVAAFLVGLVDEAEREKVVATIEKGR